MKIHNFFEKLYQFPAKNQINNAHSIHIYLFSISVSMRMLLDPIPKDPGSLPQSVLLIISLM